jgi:isoamylase
MVFLNGCAICGTGLKGERLVDDSFLLLFNAHDQPLDFTLARALPDARWRVLIDTRKVRPRASRRRFGSGERLRVEPRSVVILANSVTTTSAENHVSS